MTKTLHSAISMASLALSLSALSVDADKLCSIPPASYGLAKAEYPHLAFAIEALEQYPIAAWYTDRLSPDERAAMLQRITSECPEDSLMTIVVYGIPDKDCGSKVSSAGSVHDTAAYKDFLKDLTTGVGDRKVLYIVEPDAAALQIGNDGCGVRAGYLANLKVAIEALSMNANAELYLDVGYWTIMYEGLFEMIIPIIEELNASNQLHGIVLNTRNYRTTTEMTDFCNKVQNATDPMKLNCIIDTSRNYRAPPSEDHCNLPTAGIGFPSTSETNIPIVDYFMHIKAPGESDDACNGGPNVEIFYEAGFVKLWNQGYFVEELGMNRIEGGNNSIPAVIQSKTPNIETPMLQSTTPVPVTQTETPVTPVTQTETPVTPVTQTETPVTPVTQTETPGTPVTKFGTPVTQSPTQN